MARGAGPGPSYIAWAEAVAFWSSEGQSEDAVVLAAGGREPGGVGAPRRGRCYFWERAGIAARPARGWPGKARPPAWEENRLPLGIAAQAADAPQGDSLPPAAATGNWTTRLEASRAGTWVRPRPHPPIGGARRPRTGKPGAEGIAGDRLQAGLAGPGAGGGREVAGPTARQGGAGERGAKS